MRSWAFAVIGVILLQSTPLTADVGLPDESPDPPHSTDFTCVKKNYEKGDIECSRCEVEHDDYEADYDSCEREWAPRGYHFMCGSQWHELWCCSFGDAGVCDLDAGVPEIDGGVDKCYTGVTKCVGDTVRVCIGGIFVDWKNCKLRGGHCAYDKDGAAFCAGVSKPDDADDSEDDLDAGVGAPAGGDRDGSCSVTLKRKRNLAHQMVLVAALVGLGLLVRWRSRR